MSEIVNGLVFFVVCETGEETEIELIIRLSSINLMFYESDKLPVQWFIASISCFAN